jgi:hypothetical protein
MSIKEKGFGFHGKFLKQQLALLVVMTILSSNSVYAAELKGVPETGLLAGKTSVKAWDGDLIVIGATLPGVAIAKQAAQMKKRVLLLESGPVLATEVSAQWNMQFPDGWFAKELAAICAPLGGYKDGKFDPYITTLAVDRLVESAGVSCLVCILPVRPVAGADGKLAGVEIVGKSGRQLVTAPQVVDASQGLSFSYQACGLPVPPPSTLTRRIYVHTISVNGLPQKITVPESLQFLNNQIGIKPAMWPDEYIIDFALLPSSPGTEKIPAAAETYHRVMALMEYLKKKEPNFARALLVDISPDYKGDFSPVSPAVFSALDNTGITPVVDGSKILADKQVANDFLNRVFAKLPQRPLPLNVTPAEVKTVTANELTTAVERQFPPAMLPPAIVKWHDPSDVVVAGCGTGGSLAALVAAQQGAKVTVVDALWLPGGTGTAGRVFGYYHGLNAGLQKEMDAKTQKAQNITGAAGGPHPVAKADTIWRELESAGVKFGVQGRVFGAIKKGNAVTAVVVAAEDGYHIYPCRVAIDGTGDGDLAAAAGAKFSMGRDSDGFMLFYGYLPAEVKKGKTGYYLSGANNAMGYVDQTDTMDYSRAHFSARAELLKHGPFTAEKHFCTLAPLLGIRQGRSIQGPVILTAADFAEGKSWPDKVCSMSCNYDRGGFFALENEWIRRWVVMFGLFTYVRTSEVPYRSLYPEGIEGVLIACRAFSVDYDLASLVRMKRDIQQLGEICGLAAALAVKSGKSPSAINVAELQKMLGERGILPTAPPEKLLQLPAEELLKKLGGEQNGLAMWRLSQLPKDAGPDWKAFAATEKDQKKLFCGAVAAAMQKNAPPELIAVLEKTVDERTNGPRLGDRSSSLCVVAAIALTYADAPGAEKRIAALLADTKKIKFIYHADITLLYQALGKLGGADAVQAIRNHLATTKAPKSREDYQLQYAGVRELQAMGCFDESQRLDPLLKSDNFMVKKAAMKLVNQKTKK